MNKIMLDTQSKAIFSFDKVGDHINLKGLNLEGSFKIPTGLEHHFTEIDKSQMKKYKYKDKWPERLAELLVLGSKIKKRTANSISIRLDNVTWRDNKFTEEDITPKKRVKKKPIKEDKPKPEIKEVKVSAKKGQPMTLAQICDQIGIKPAAARGKLRGQIDKPADGWKWEDSKEIQKIIGLLS